MELSNIIGWIFIPYIMIFLKWKQLKNMRKVAAFTWIAIIVIGVVINTNKGSEDKTVSSTPVENQKLDNQKQSTDNQKQSEETAKAILGEPLSSFDKVLGKGKENTFVSYKNDYIVVMPMDKIAFNITIAFEQTDKKRRTKEEAIIIAKDFIPSDAVKIKEWQVEKGKDVIQYESKTLAEKFNASIFRDNPVGTFIVILKSDDNGVFSVVTSPGNNP